MEDSSNMVVQMEAFYSATAKQNCLRLLYQHPFFGGVEGGGACHEIVYSFDKKDGKINKHTIFSNNQNYLKLPEIHI